MIKEFCGGKAGWSDKAIFIEIDLKPASKPEAAAFWHCQIYAKAMPKCLAICSITNPIKPSILGNLPILPFLPICGLRDHLSKSQSIWHDGLLLTFDTHTGENWNQGPLELWVPHCLHSLSRILWKKRTNLKWAEIKTKMCCNPDTWSCSDGWADDEVNLKTTSNIKMLMKEFSLYIPVFSLLQSSWRTVELNSWNVNEM